MNDSLQGSYDSHLSVRVGCGVKYGFVDGEYYIEIEGSFHKITKGYNSHDGIYNLQCIVKGFIEMAENSYDVKLPEIKKWYLQRIDIAKCFDIESQKNVIDYINTLASCRYSRREVKPYAGGINVAGTVTTLKVYNKMLEFKKHDEKKFRNTNFDLLKYYTRIEGFIRFEVEIKKKKLKKIYGEDKKHISVINLEYKDFEKVWSDEFMKLLGMIEKDLKVVKDKKEIKERLLYLYGKTMGNRLFCFYCSIQMDGLDFVKKDMSKPTFYRYIKLLKEAKVDYTQRYKMEKMETFYFNPFEWEEVI